MILHPALPYSLKNLLLTDAGKYSLEKHHRVLTKAVGFFGAPSKSDFGHVIYLCEKR